MNAKIKCFLFVFKRKYICYYIICVTVPLTKLKLYLFLHLFRMATMLECFLYFQIAFKVRLDFSCSLDRVHHLTNLKYQDFKLYWKRDYLKTTPVSRSVWTSLLFSIKLILSLWTHYQIGKVLHASRRICCRPQTLRLRFHEISFFAFLKRDKKILRFV